MSDDRKIKNPEQSRGNKNILDSDADGLLDSEEEKLGTDPKNPDTDNDGLGDYQEAKVYDTDPNDPDTDHDQVEDGLEVMLGRNPKGRGSLSKLFIPSESNSYKPHILHPKRLAFHAVSAIVVKAIMVLFALSLPVQAWLSPDILYQEAQKIITLTNNIRNDLGLGTLTENQILSQSALNKAEDMMIDQYFAHVSPDERSLKNWLYDLNYNFRVAGENLAMGFSTADKVVAAWQESPTHYSNLVDPEFTEIGVGVVSGEYNGYETTLVAQHFGDPYRAPESVFEPVEPQIEVEIPKPADYNSKVEQALENLAEEPEINNQEEIVEDVVLAEKDVSPEVLEPTEQIVLAQPILISPLNKTIFKDNINVLTISAFGADRVAILSKNQTIANKVLESEEFDIAVKLPEGENQVQILAYQGDKSVASKVYLLTVDKSAPVLDHDKTSILVNRPAESDDIVLKVTAYLSQDTKEASVDFAGYQIALDRDFSEEGKWIGHKIISNVNYKELFNPLTLATLTAEDEIGNKLSQDIEWQEIKPVAGSVLNQYSFLKKSNSEFTGTLFNIGNVYYQLMLIIAFVALMLNIFIKIRKQHTSTIASTLGLMALLVILTIF